MKKGTLAAVFAVGLSLAAVADRTVNENVTLNADADWRADGTITIAAGVTVDLNGHKLQVNALAGDGQVVDSAVNPYYRRLEYIQSSANTAQAGTHYIDAGWQHDANGYCVETVFKGVKTIRYPTLCGNVKSWNSGSYLYFDTNYGFAWLYFRVGNGTTYFDHEIPDGDFRYVKAMVKTGTQFFYEGEPGGTVNGPYSSKVSQSGTLVCAENRNWYIFAANNAGGADYSGNFQLKYLKIYSSADTQDETTLARDFIPVKLKADLPAEKDSQGVARPANTIGLWDLKEGKFYCSKTATPFTGGEVVPSAGCLEIDATNLTSIPALSVTLGDEVELDWTVYGEVALASDRDLRTEVGTVKIAEGATLDINGHVLKVNSLTGEGEVVDSTVNESYVQLEYIQSSANTAQAGTHYIDAGWQHDANGYCVETVFKGVKTIRYPTLCGNVKSWNSGSYLYFDTNYGFAWLYFRVGNGTTYFNHEIPDGDFRYIKATVKTGTQFFYEGEPGGTVNGPYYSKVSQSGTLVCAENRNWYIFAANNAGGADYSGNFLLKYLKIYSSADTQDETTLVRDFIPVRLLTAIGAAQDSQGTARAAGTIGLWDKTEDKFYASKTATPFTGGEALSGLVEVSVNGSTVPVTTRRVLADNVIANWSLTQDIDWSERAEIVLRGADTLDLAGHELVLGNNVTGTPTFTTATAAELHLKVPANATLDPSYPINGAITVVKDGAGTYSPSSVKLYTGKTVIAEGWLKLPNTTAKVLGQSTRLDILDGAGLDIVHWTSNGAQTTLNANSIDVYAEGTGPGGNGAIIDNSSNDYWGHTFKRLYLTGNTTIGGNKRIDFRSANAGIYGEGYVLTIKNTSMVAVCVDATTVQVKKIVIDGGVYQPCKDLATLAVPEGIEVKNGGVLAPYGTFTTPASVPIRFTGNGTIRNDKNLPVLAGDITIDDGCQLTMSSPVSFTGAFDFSANTQPLDFSAVAFRSGATVNVKVGARAVPARLVSWNAVPEGIDFALASGETTKGRLFAEADGLYLRIRSLVVIIR